MRSYYAKLVDKKVVPIEGPVRPLTADEMHQVFDIKNCRVAEDFIGNAYVSTVFLGINHGWHGRDIWFETMIFPYGGKNKFEDYQERYETYEEAIAGHARAVALVKGE